MRPRDFIRAILIALLATSLSLEGSGAMALASGSGLPHVASDGRDHQPLVARPAASVSRFVTRPRASSPDDQGGRQLAAALTARARDGAAVSERFLSGRAPRCTPRRFPATVRSSRGPPQG